MYALRPLVAEGQHDWPTHLVLTAKKLVILRCLELKEELMILRFLELKGRIGMALKRLHCSMGDNTCTSATIDKSQSKTKHQGFHELESA